MNKQLGFYLKLIGMPVAVALLLHMVFNIDAFDEWMTVMTISFLFGLPALIGALTIYFSKEHDVKSISYRIFMPWVPIVAFFVLTLLFSMEGWACWVMAMPLFLVLASIGGLIMGYLLTRVSNKANRLNVAIAVVLPLLLAPLESTIGPTMATFEAYTYIDIESEATSIWPYVTRVAEIQETEDTGWLGRKMGIPRPIRAELDFEGVNAHREAIFSGGVVFDEVVTAYEHEKMMRFAIKPNTVDIPSTTFDEHVLIGGKYFDVLEGKYWTEDLGNGFTRLHLSSEFKLNTTFNFYAGVWARWIMSDIQNNILRVIKQRSEKGN